MHRILPIIVLASACADPLVGAWEEPDDGMANLNNLTLDNSLTGDSLLYFSNDDTNYSAVFAVEAEWDEEIVEIDFECRDTDFPAGTLDYLNFSVECNMNDDGDHMDCDADGIWRNYPMEWEKISE